MSAIQGAIDEVEKYIRQLQDLSARLRECEGILAPKGREAAPDKVRDAETASLPVKTKPARKGKPRKGGGRKRGVARSDAGRDGETQRLDRP